MSRHRLTVLMLGGARRVSMAELLAQSGRRMGYEIQTVSYELMRQVPIATVGTVVEGLKWTDPCVVDDIARVAREYEADIILPFVDGAIEVASRCREVLPDVFIPVSDEETARRTFDKTEAAAMFREARLPIPKTYTVISAEMPAIAKPRHGSASRGIKVFHNIEDLMHLENLHDYLIQEYIEDKEEYTVDCYVAADGRVLCTVPRIRLEVMGGEVTRTATRRIPELMDMSRKVLGAFRFRGPVTLQFLHDLRTGRYLLMEINPRLGGGVVCSIHAGAPIADYIISEALGVEVRECTDWTDNTLMARYWKEVMFYNS